MVSSNEFQRNQLLAKLPAATLDRLKPLLEGCELHPGKALKPLDGKFLHAYFPVSGLVSWLVYTSQGKSTEVAALGRNGLVGVWNLLGNTPPPWKVLVSHKGYAYRIKIDDLRLFCDREPALQSQFFAFLRLLLTHMSQAIGCNRHHPMDRKLAKWLLLRSDNLARNELMITQQFIAGMLGVRREDISAAIRKLQGAGLVAVKREHITIIDGPGLEKAACECLKKVRAVYSN